MITPTPAGDHAAELASRRMDLATGRLKGAGIMFGFDLAVRLAFDREQPVHKKLIGAAGWSAAFYIAPQLAGAYMFGQLGGVAWQLTKGMNEATRMNFSHAVSPGFHTTDVFAHTNPGQILSERQRSINAIQTQMFNARSAIGGEASMMRKTVDDFVGGLTP